MDLRADRSAATAAALVATLVAAATAAGLTGAWVRAARTFLPSPFGPLWSQLLVTAVAAASVGVAWLSRPTPGAPLGLALALAGWLVPFWAAWAELPDPVRAACLAAPPLIVVGGAVCALGWRSPVPRRHRTLGTALCAPALVAVALHVLGYDPFADPHCRLLCTHVRPALDGVLTTRQTLAVAGALTLLSGLATGVALATTRNAPGIVRLAAGVALIPLGLVTVRPETSETVFAAGILVLDTVIAATTAQSWRVRSALRRLVDNLTTTDAAGAHPAATGAVQFAVGDRWINGRGEDITAGGASWLVITDGHQPWMRLAVPQAGDPDAVLAGLTPATRLALTNARLAAVVHAQVAEVSASQRRIVTASDRERRRIERDLHDGAQQQLVSIALHLRAARNQLPPQAGGDLAAELDAAESSVHTALAGLRRLAHGIFPAALGDEGLAAALEDAATGCGAVVDLAVRLDAEPDLGAAMAAYATTALAFDLADAQTRVEIRLDRLGEHLLVRWSAVPAPRVPAPDAVEAVRDRVGALGGTLSVRSPEVGRVESEAVIPCESWSRTT